MSLQADVVIVGAGNAAMCAALSAREHGASVIVLERALLVSRSLKTMGWMRGQGIRFQPIYGRQAIPDLSWYGRPGGRDE